MIKYTEAGKYVAICIHTNGKSHYAKTFDFPTAEERENPANGGFASPPGIDASWYFLNRVDPVAWLEAVYPISLFEERFTEVPAGTNVRPARFGPGDNYE